MSDKIVRDATTNLETGKTELLQNKGSFPF